MIMVRESIFTDKRRELLAKTFMDIAKIFVAAALASEFFKKFPLWLRAILLASTIGLLTFATLVCPKRVREEKEC